MFASVSLELYYVKFYNLVLFVCCDLLVFAFVIVD